MQWVFYALLSAVFAALVAIFGKLGLSGVDSTLAATVRAVIMAVFLVLLASFLGRWNLSGQIDSKAFLAIAVSGIFGALSWLFYFLALKTGQVGAVSAVDKTSVAFAFLLSALFLGETMTWKSAVGIILVFLGAVMFVV